MKLHDNPQHFIQVVENALQQCYVNNGTSLELWIKIHKFYEKRYLNPNSLYKNSLQYSYVNLIRKTQ